VLDDAHNIYIADTSNNRVVSISPRGQYRGQLLQGQPNEPLNRPAAVAVGPGGVLAVADSWNHRVVLFDTKGKPGMVFGGRGVERGQLNQPCGVVFDLDGGLIVSDTGNNRLQKFSPSGIPVAVWYGDGAVGNLNNPGCVALTRDGDIYLADTGNHRVLRFEMW
jgi:DNA-binding beta-propeller fold protein YncE